MAKGAPSRWLAGGASAVPRPRGRRGAMGAVTRVGWGKGVPSCAWQVGLRAQPCLWVARTQNVSRHSVWKWCIAAGGSAETAARKVGTLNYIGVSFRLCGQFNYSASRQIISRLCSVEKGVT